MGDRPAESWLGRQAILKMGGWMLKPTLFVWTLLLGSSAFVVGDGRQPIVAVEVQQGDIDSTRWDGVQSSPDKRPARKKTCSEQYPVPEAAKHWTGCQSGEYSQCGGPDECACAESDDRLIWYHCKEGSYPICEDDNTCTDGS
jgi:hypothetical protein